jgi:hypothetical protein
MFFQACSLGFARNGGTDGIGRVVSPATAPSPRKIPGSYLGTETACFDRYFMIFFGPFKQMLG